MNVTRNRVLVAVGCAVVVAVGFVLFGVVQDLAADPAVVEEAVESDTDAAEAAASVSE